jgi:tetratricopeptide (TPR) repeat protein
MIVVAAALFGPTLTAWAYPPQAPVLSDAQKNRLKERDKLIRQALAFRDRGKTAEAIRGAESVLAIEREVLGESSGAAIGTMRMLAQWNEDREDWTAAAKARSEILAIVTRKFGKDSADATEARWALVQVATLSRSSDHDRRRFKEAMELERQAKELLAQGKVNEAIPLLRKVPPIRKDVLGERASGYVVALMNLGLALESLGQRDEALRYYETALRISQQICNNSHSLLALNHEYLAGALEA